MSKTIHVTKRNGKLEELQIDKIHQVVEWACDGIKDVSVSEIVINSELKFYDKMPTYEIHQSLINTTEELTSVDHPNYDLVASRLFNFDLRKKVYGDFLPPENEEFLTLFRSYVDDGIYVRDFKELSDEDIIQTWAMVTHDRDYSITTYGMKQIVAKYCVQSRTTGRVYETPTMAFYRIALLGALIKNSDDLVKTFKEYYNQFSQGDNSLPSPVMGGVGTPVKQFSSCTGIDSGDDLESISSAATAIIRYASQRSGIGLNVGRIRALGEPVRNGEVSHTGLVPFIQMFQGSVHAVSQGGMRKTAATLYFPIWHYEFPELVILKDNTLIEENSAKHLDYGVTVNGYLYKRLLQGKDISLFSPNVAGGELYETFASNQERFAELYEELEANPLIRRRTLTASEIFTQMLMTQRKETGRIYIMNIDNVNMFGSFDETIAPVHFSNLCAEIVLPSKPMHHIDNYKDSEIFLCTLGNINMGRIKNLSSLERICYNLVRFLDDLLDYQGYPVPAAEYWAKQRRSLGIGVNNYAYWLANQGLVYGEKEALEKTHEFFEALQYYLIKASVEVAKEKGPCGAFGDTKYAQGIMPVDNYKKEVDELGNFTNKMDWDSLRQEVLTHGMRNSVLSAQPPSETSANILPFGSTNGIEPARDLITLKSNRDVSGKVLVPGVKKLKNKYDLLWDQEGPEGYLKTVAVIQKWMDQSISANTSYNPEHYPDGNIPMSVLMKHALQFYRWGGKTLYYQNTKKQSSTQRDEKVDDVVPLQSTSPYYNENVEEDDCDSCSI